MKRIPFFLTLLSITCLHAGIEQYFKSVGDKSDYKFGQMQNIDFIYTINLDQRPEKLAHCLNALAPYNIKPHRFSAVNGWELSLEAINDLGVKFEPWMTSMIWGTSYLPNKKFLPYYEIMHIPGRTYFCHHMPKGSIGIILSHLSILQDAYDSDYETIWVMEDDIEIIQDPHLLSNLIESLDNLVGKNHWDILFTDQNTKDHDGQYVPCIGYAKKPNFFPENPDRFYLTETLNNTFRKIGARYGAYSMIIRRSGMKKLLDHFKTYNLFLPYDMEYYLPTDIALYTLIDDVVSTQHKAPSDNGKQGYIYDKN